MAQRYNEYSALSKKQFKAITYDWNVLTNYSPVESKMYCLTDFQANWLLSNVDYLSWSSRQIDCPCTDDELAQLSAEMAYNLMNCCDFSPYQQQYVYDQISNQQLGVFNDDYTGTPSSVNSNTPDDFFSGDGSSDRLDALCSACKVYVYSYSANWQTKAQIALGIAGVFTALASISLVGGVIAGSLLAGLAFITSVAYDAMRDETALDNVVCCMFDQLSGSPINQANFEFSLSACSFAVGSNEAIIRDIIASDLVQFSNYLSFLNALGDQFVLSQAGVVDCPCDQTWEHTFDFIANGAEGWSPFIGRATLTAGGWQGTVLDANAVQIETTFPSTVNITEMEVFNGGLASGACGNFYSFRFPDSVGSDGQFNTNSSVVTANVTSNGMWFSLCYGGDLGVTIQRIILRGTGVNPF